MNGEPLNMSIIRRWTTSTSPFWVALLGLTLVDGQAHAGGPHFKKQVIYVAQAPTTTTAQAPVLYTTPASIAYTGLAPVKHYHRTSVLYAAQAPATYTAQAPVTYVTSTGAAPVANAPTTSAAPGTANAPAAATGVRISTAIRVALHADLVAFYQGADSGDTRIDKIKAVRDRARQEYQDLIDGDDQELNAAEVQDVNNLVDWVITGGSGGAQPTYYAPLGTPGHAPSVGGPTFGASPSGAGIQAVTYWVPIYARPQTHLHRLLNIP